MASSMSNSMQTKGLASLSLKMDQETKLVQKQGIVTILGFDSERAKARVTASSLRRTLSADMSSKRCLDSQNRPYPMKKISSFEQLSHSNIIADSFSSSEGEDDHEDGKEMEAEGESERGQFDIWSSIQQDKNKEQEKEAGQFDIWSSIISQKANDDTIKSLPNYVHPLVKRSQSSLSEKSLEICTESLGSETGSDGFSYPPSDTGDAEEDKEEEQQEEPERVAVQPFEAEECLPKYNYSAAAKKSPPRSFPPPLSSLSRPAWPSLHIWSHRDNGRLVLEAVSVSSQNNFRAQRQDGRLVLSFANLPNHEESKEDATDTEEKEEHHMEDMGEEFWGDQEETEHEEFDDDENETEEEEVGGIEIDESENWNKTETVTEQAPILSCGIAGVHRLAMMINTPVGLVNKDPKWSKNFNKAVEFEDVKVAEPTSVAKSLPPRPRVARFIPSAPAATSAASAASLNTYEYYWRTKPTPTASAVAKPLTHKQNNSYLSNSSKVVFSKDISQTPNEQQQLVVLRGKNGDYLVHKLKSCKESRGSLLFWKPYCIATS